MKFNKIVLLVFTVFFLSNCKKEVTETPIAAKTNWRFAVVGDTHVTANSDTIKEMIPYFIQDSIDLILVCGDIVEGTKAITPVELKLEFEMWLEIFKPLYDNGIKVYPVRGNHEDGAPKDIEMWNEIFTGSKALPQNGPIGEINLTYSFNYKNAMFVGLDNYVDIHKVNQTWLNERFAENNLPHVFVFGHEAGFKVFHSDCLDDFPVERNTFWKSMADAGVRTYFCGHDHFFDAALIEDNDGNSNNNIYQCLVGGGGGWLMSKYNYNGDNSTYTIGAKYHQMAHGYVLVEINGESTTDKEVSITWKERLEQGTNVTYVATDKVIKYTVH